MSPNKISISLDKAIRYILIAAAVLALSAGITGKSYAEGPKKITKESAAESLRRDYPGATFSSIEESGIEGIYEVMAGTNVVYYSPATGRIIIGDMRDKTGRNFTAEKRNELVARHQSEMAKLIDTLPLEKAIKIGSGKNVVVEFTDLDCPYCRRVEEFFKERTDITRYVFLFPLEQIHPTSMAKSKEVLCSKDPADAYNIAMDGGFDKAELKGCGDREKEIEGLLVEHKKLAEKMEVSGTPMMWVNKKPVSGADFGKIESSLIPDTKK